MKHSIFNILSTIITVGISFSIQGCDDYTIDSPRKAVIEGYFCSGDHPYVIFSSSVVPSISGNVADAVINWGKVTISDEDTTIVLTGRVDDSYIPPYVYYSFDMVGIPGKTYSVSAEFKDLKAHASMKMPYPVAIDSITLSTTDIDTLRAATLHLTSPEETPSYFYISMKKNDNGQRMLPCMMGTIKTDLPGAHYSIPVLHPRVKMDSTQYISQLIVGEEWTVSLNRIESPVYNFWKSYDDMVMFSTSPFISTTESLPTNIIGGFGIWSVEGSFQTKLKVE
ncbi:MAG: DUF4249 domain-containing protein [Muribaculaceae bacterium]|nr:DUF4249 domain-containing protein [Muribaculaceae bacterium]